MWIKAAILLFGYLLQSQLVLSAAPCTQNSDCSDVEGALCVSGNCACPAGQQFVFGNSQCAVMSPYIKMPCIEDNQCSRLLINFQCRRDSDHPNEPGECVCREGYHFLHSRCWRTAGFGAACNRDEECLGQIFHPSSLSCDATTRTCRCSDGYYFRQREECRKIASGPDDRCIINEDCQFVGGICNIETLRCETAGRSGVQPSLLEQRNATIQHTPSVVQQNGRSQHGVQCTNVNPCANPFVCYVGTCVCPIGYFGIDGSSQCYAELGAPSTEEQCGGLFSELRDGICTCPPNFFYEKDLRDCIKASRTLTDSCVSDEMCHTFGYESRCGPPSDPWGIRNCECIDGISLWDPVRSMCRSFVGIGEICQEDRDCLAGDQDIDCVFNDQGVGICSCPDDTLQEGQLCITTGLELGDDCQITQECTGTPNTVCEDRRCSCSEGYLEMEGACVSVIGGICTIDEECVTENSVCVEEGNTSICRCHSNFITLGQECIPMLTDIEDPCNMTIQCTSLMGVDSECGEEGWCVCTEGHHFRDGWCWRMTALFQECSRSSQCFLSNITDRVVCRNSLCQCDFRYPYSEELHTCEVSSASALLSSSFTILLAVYYVLSH